MESRSTFVGFGQYIFDSMQLFNFFKVLIALFIMRQTHYLKVKPGQANFPYSVTWWQTMCTEELLKVPQVIVFLFSQTAVASW